MRHFFSNRIGKWATIIRRGPIFWVSSLWQSPVSRAFLGIPCTHAWYRHLPHPVVLQFLQPKGLPGAAIAAKPWPAWLREDRPDSYVYREWRRRCLLRITGALLLHQHNYRWRSRWSQGCSLDVSWWEFPARGRWARKSPGEGEGEEGMWWVLS